MRVRKRQKALALVRRVKESGMGTGEEKLPVQCLHAGPGQSFQTSLASGSVSPHRNVFVLVHVSFIRQLFTGALCAKRSSTCRDLPVTRAVRNPACVYRGGGGGPGNQPETEHSKLLTESMSAVDKTAQALGSPRE